MVEDAEQQVLVRREAEQREAQERPAGEGERAAGLDAGEARRRGLAPGGRERGEVEDRRGRQRHGTRRGHRLDRPAGHLREAGAQGLVAADDLRGSGGERRHGEPAAQPHGDRHVVERALRLQAVEEPEPLLGEGERHPRGRPGLWHEGERSRPMPLPQGALDLPRQIGEDRCVEQGAQGEVEGEGLAQAGDQLGGEERMAAQREEVVVGAHPVAREDLCPDRAQHLLDRCARRQPGAVGAGALGLWRGEGAAVDLAGRGERQGVEHHESGGDHVGRQHPAQEGAQLGGPRTGRRQAAAGDHVADQASLARRVGGRPVDDHGARHLGVARERRLDLPQLDAEPPHLDLVVPPAEELNAPVAPPPPEVAGAIQAASGAPWIGAEAVGRQVRPAEIAAGEAAPAEPDLARHAREDRLQVGVEQQRAVARRGQADRRRAVPHPEDIDRVQSGVDRRLGRAVAVEEAAPGALGQQRLREPRGERLAAQEQGAHPGRYAVAAQQLRRRRGDHGSEAHRVARRQAGQLEGVLGEDHGAAVGEREEQLEHREVEAHRGRGEHPGELLRPEEGGRAGEAGGHAAMRHRHPLGAPGRAGRVDHREELRRINARALTPASPLSRGGGRRGGRGGQGVRAPLCHQRTGAGVRQHGIQPLLRIGGVQGDVGGAGLEDPEDRRHQVR